jgi:CHAT domain-containing protein
MQADLAADLVTLSACSTGLQAVTNAGDEVAGFSRALLAAGASSALLAMWNVDQESSQAFLTKFYSELDTRGNVRGKWRALRAAQLSFIGSNDEKLKHPYHWAPFVLIGDWR